MKKNFFETKQAKLMREGRTFFVLKLSTSIAQSNFSINIYKHSNLGWTLLDSTSSSMESELMTEICKSINASSPETANDYLDIIEEILYSKYANFFSYIESTVSQKTLKDKYSVLAEDISVQYYSSCHCSYKDERFDGIKMSRLLV